MSKSKETIREFFEVSLYVPDTSRIKNWKKIFDYFKCLISHNNRGSIWWCACGLVFVCGWISQMFRWKLSRPTQLWSNRGGINHFQFSRSCYSTNDSQKYCNASSSLNRPPSQLGKALLKSGPSIWAMPKLLLTTITIPPPPALLTHDVFQLLVWNRADMPPLDKIKGK